MPLVGDVKAAGLTPAELQKQLTDALATLMEAPKVSVMVQDARSQRINVMGEVARPGTYSLTKPMTVLDALSVAGGFRDFARTRRMFILRNLADGQPASHSRGLQEGHQRQRAERELRASSARHAGRAVGKDETQSKTPRF